jgi:hypothetical protein
VITNLVPVTFPSQSGLAVSDGLGFIRSFSLPDEAFAAMMHTPEFPDDEDRFHEQEWKENEDDWRYR